MIEDSLMLDWLNSDKKVKRECQQILKELFEAGNLELEPTGIASVDMLDKDKLVVMWGNEGKNMTSEHFQVIPIKWLTDETVRKGEMKKLKEENKIEIAKADKDYKKYLELKKKFAAFGL